MAVVVERNDQQSKEYTTTATVRKNHTAFLTYQQLRALRAVRRGGNGHDAARDDQAPVEYGVQRLAPPVPHVLSAQGSDDLHHQVVNGGRRAALLVFDERLHEPQEALDVALEARMNANRKPGIRVVRATTAARIEGERPALMNS